MLICLKLSMAFDWARVDVMYVTAPPRLPRNTVNLEHEQPKKKS